jgi:hypothetical protein
LSSCSRDRFAPSSAVERAKNHIADYDRLSGKFLRFVETMNGRQPGGADKAADAIIGAVESDAPPLAWSWESTRTTRCEKNSPRLLKAKRR